MHSRLRCARARLKFQPPKTSFLAPVAKDTDTANACRPSSLTATSTSLTPLTPSSARATSALYIIMQAPAPAQTFGQWLDAQNWEQTRERPTTSAAQKTPSLKEEYTYHLFERVERTANLPFLVDHQAQVAQLMNRTDIVPPVAVRWGIFASKGYNYHSESELEVILGRLWDVLNSGIPDDQMAFYPPSVRDAHWMTRTVYSGYSGGHKGIRFDIAAYIQTASEHGADDTTDYVYLLVETKTERALRAKLTDLEARIEAGNMPKRALSQLKPAEQMLVQVSSRSQMCFGNRAPQLTVRDHRFSLKRTRRGARPPF